MSKIDVEDVLIKVITRSKAIKESQVQTNEMGAKPKEKVKCKARRRPRSKKTKNQKSQDDKDQGKPSQEKETTRVSNSSETSSGGSVIVDKVFEPLQAAMDAYNSRIAALKELPKKLQEYPNPREENINLAVHQHRLYVIRKPYGKDHHLTSHVDQPI